MLLMVGTIMLSLWGICHEVVMLKAWANPQPVPSGVNPSASSSNTVAGTTTSPHFAPPPTSTHSGTVPSGSNV